MSFNIQEIALLFISFQSLMFAIILLTSKSPKKSANSILATFLIVLCLQMSLLLAERLVWDFDELIPFLCLFGFVYGPLLLLYTRSLIYEEFQFLKSDFLHAIPVGIMLISALAGYGLCAKFGSLLYVSLIIYSSLAVKAIIAYRKVVRQTRSTISEMTLSWLEWTLVIFTVTFLVDIYQHFYHDIDLIPGLSLVNLSLLVLINGMFYKGLKQPMIFQGISLHDESIVSQNVSINEDSEEVSSQIELLLDLMENEKPYQDSGLTLNGLAELLDFPSRKLSSLINRHFNQNFIDFINTYRIELAKTRLMAPTDPKETVMEVMYEVGFNSKSSFNTLFKQKTGLTPTEFKKQQV